MNMEFNKRAMELFGPDVANMLGGEEETFVALLMDDISQETGMELNGMTRHEIANQVILQREKRYLYVIYSRKFIVSPENRDPKAYDEYSYGYVPWTIKREQEKYTKSEIDSWTVTDK